ncbi:MAG: hypothetical protein ACI9S8_002785, partial [Chlamydiales bacterium]
SSKPEMFSCHKFFRHKEPTAAALRKNAVQSAVRPLLLSYAFFSNS